MQARFFAGDFFAAIEASGQAERLLWISISFFEVAEYHFFSALSQAALLDTVTGDSRQRHIEALAVHQKQHEIWVASCPENFENRAALICAEIARIEGRLLDAEQLYEQAIRSARSNGFVQNEAIAYELAARFYAGRGFQKFAEAYLLEARYCYQRWGADGKVAQLDSSYPQLRKQSPAPQGSTILVPAGVLDLATVIKVSQAVSGELVLEKLIDSLMRTAIEHAGAERGLLILPHGEHLTVEAQAIVGGSEVVVHRRDVLAPTDVWPESVVRYVLRTGEAVILDDANAENPSSDPYFAQKRVRSVLCLPLVHQTKVTGVLYLENNLAAHVFTPDRATVLKVIVSQAAISLENTRLYRDLENREAKIRRLVDSNILGIFIWSVDGAIVEGNEAFQRMLQYGRDDLDSGRVRWRDLTPPEWREHDENALADLLSIGTVQPYRKEYLRKDGVRLPVLVGGALFEKGGQEGVGFVLDLSEQERAENSLRKTQEELRDTQTQFAHANRVMTMGELTASIAHEVNQPLAAIVSSAESCTAWLANDPPSLAKARAAADRIVQAATQANEIVQRIRGLFQKSTAMTDTVDVNAVIGETILFVAREAQRMNVSVQTQLDTGLPVVRADRVQLQQVILNLMMNGMEAMDGYDGPKSLCIRSGLSNAQELLVSVMDTGPGIDVEHMGRLFAPFFTTKPRGIGMGLRISRSIIEAHGGRLWAESNKPHGAVFHLVLPIGSSR
ncbi:MAG: ATP-binding protein [Bryobacteraceae bacterium]